MCKTCGCGVKRRKRNMYVKNAEENRINRKFAVVRKWWKRNENSRYMWKSEEKW